MIVVPQRLKNQQAHLVLQSFTGWRVKTDWPNWDPSQLVLMDFNIPQNGFTQFMYILPIDEHEALVEVTRFGSEVLPEELATTHLRSYLLGLEGPYDVVHEEQGVIPMTHMPCSSIPTRIISMGARGGLSKPTTGYGFKYMYDRANELVKSEQQSVSAKASILELASNRHRATLLLRPFTVTHIEVQAAMGQRDLYKSISPTEHTREFLDFLDEKSTLRWELGMFAGLPIMKFLWAVVASFFAFLKLDRRAGHPWPWYSPR
jgi:lycopene beta-cyclase